jgi:hypothetical protein
MFKTMRSEGFYCLTVQGYESDEGKEDGQGRLKVQNKGFAVEYEWAFPLVFIKAFNKNI